LGIATVSYSGLIQRTFRSKLGIRSDPDQAIIQTLDELAGLYGEFFSAEILNMRDQGVPYNWNDFEIIIPHRIDPSRFMKVLKDRPPKKPIVAK
jgi:hypothetical protein